MSRFPEYLKENNKIKDITLIHPYIYTPSRGRFDPEPTTALDLGILNAANLESFTYSTDFDIEASVMSSLCFFVQESNLKNLGLIVTGFIYWRNFLELIEPLFIAIVEGKTVRNLNITVEVICIQK